MFCCRSDDPWNIKITCYNGGFKYEKDIGSRKSE